MPPMRAIHVLVAAALAAAPAAAEADAGRLETARAERDALAADVAAVLDDYLAAGAAAEASGRTLARVDEMLGDAAGSETDLEQRISAGAVDAYMAAMTGGPSVVLDQGSAERAIVAVDMLARVHSDSVSELAALAGHLRELEELRAEQARLREELAARQETLSREAARLRALLAGADAEVAAAEAALAAADRRAAAVSPTTTVAPARPGGGEASSTGAGSADPTPRPSGHPVEDWRPIVARHFPDRLVEDALAVMDCESGGDPEAVNPSTGAAGLFQFLPGTWAVAASGAGVGDAPPTDGEANIAAAAWLASHYERRTGDPWRPWGCRSVL